MSTSVESLAWLKHRLGDACTEVPVQGDRPLLLDDPSCAYVTLSEHHQLFCVGYARGDAVGRREHMATCQPGQLLLGLANASGGGATALMLSGVSGSIVWRIPTALLYRLTDESDGQEVIGGLLERWFELLIQTLPCTAVPARSVSVSAGEAIESDADIPLRADAGIIWLAPRATPPVYSGMDLTTLGLSINSWLIGAGAWGVFGVDRFRACTTRELIRTNGSLEFADGFHALVLAIVSTRRTDLADGRLIRDRASRGAEREAIAIALSELAAVGRGERLHSQLGRDPFERACGLIAQHMRIEPPQMVKPTGTSLAHMQMALSRTTSVRTRSVLLTGSWYRHDSGPLLGFVLEQGGSLSPVALLPHQGEYLLHDARKPVAIKLDRAIAAELHPQAYQFYASLPERVSSPFDILRFATIGARRDVAGALAIGIGAGALGTLVPLLTAQVFDRIIPGAERSLLRELTWVLLSVYFGEALFDVARGFTLVKAQTRTDARLEAGVWDRILCLPLPFFRRYSAGELAQRAAGIGGIREVLAGASLSALLGGVFSLWNFALLFYIDPTLALGASGLVLLSGLVAGAAAFYGLRRQRQVVELDGKIGGLVLQLLTGIAKLRVTGSENRAFAVWARLFARRRDAELGTERVNIRVAVFQTAYPLLCSALLFGLLSARHGERLSTGQFLAFSTAFAIFMTALLEVIDSGLHALSVVPMYERAGPILTESLESRGSGETRIELKGGVELSHISFRYDEHGPLILDDVNLSIEPTEFVAIVGPSGSGKSTLLRILLGFENPSGGGVFYDRQALVTLDLRVARQQIGVVLQNSRLMPGDIFSNIVGNTGLGIDDAWRAASQAAFDKDIEAMPMGMHTVLSQGGGTLSGGQRQRLLIARALATRPKILYFDEATSALDNITQSMVSESLSSLRVTRVVIAHRLSTIQHADKIVVLDRGRVIQTGRFNELIRVEGLFRELAKRQTV